MEAMNATDNQPKELAMTADQLKEWRQSLNLTQQAASDALGIRLSNYQILERGRKFGIDDAPRAIDRRTALACAAIAAGLEPYGD